MQATFNIYTGEFEAPVQRAMTVIVSPKNDKHEESKIDEKMKSLQTREMKLELKSKDKRI